MTLAAFSGSLAAIAMNKRERAGTEREQGLLLTGRDLSVRTCVDLSARGWVDGVAR